MAWLTHVFFFFCYLLLSCRTRRLGVASFCRGGRRPQDVLGIHMPKSSIIHEMIGNMVIAVEEQGVELNALGVGLVCLAFLILMKLLTQAYDFECVAPACPCCLCCCRCFFFFFLVSGLLVVAVLLLHFWLAFNESTNRHLRTTCAVHPSLPTCVTLDLAQRHPTLHTCTRHAHTTRTPTCPPRHCLGLLPGNRALRGAAAGRSTSRTWSPST